MLNARKMTFFSQKYIYISLLFLSLFVKELSNDIIEIENALFPITLTLSNRNILLISNSSITFFNSFLNSTIKTYPLSENEHFYSKEETYKILACQYPNEYILLFIMGYIKVFSQDGNKIQEMDSTEFYNNLPLNTVFNLIPIKIESNYIYYMIAFTQIDDFSINLYYSGFSLEGNDFNVINKMKYNLTNFIKNDEFSVFITNITCELMENNIYNNILVCFYISSYPFKIHMTSFNIESLEPINNLYKYIDFNINYIKSKCNENKSKALICYSSYGGPGYCSIYDINKNNISEPIKYISHIGSYITDIEIYYFKQTEEFILFTRGSDNAFRLIIFDKNFVPINNEGELISKNFPEYHLSLRDSIIYLPQYKKYSIISDMQSNDLKHHIRIFITDFTSEIKNDNINNNNINNNSINNNNINNINNNSINNNNINNNNINNNNINLLNNEKCLYSNEESSKLNLCTVCNNALGYYPVNYNYKNNLIYKYKECFNDKTKPINFFFNKEKEEYEPCYETCRTCNSRGNATINNCITCDFDGIFRPEKNSTNCVKECKYRYYITSYGQYKCTKDNQCNNIASLYIKKKDKCINNCSLDDIYIYQYNGECLIECPENTKPENNICIAINKEICSYDLIEYNIEKNLTNENIDLIAKSYSNEYIYTNNHISLFKHDYYIITLYKNKECINNLGLGIPQIDFGNCTKKVKNKYNINNNLLILIIEKYNEGKSIILYSLYNPITGEKLDTKDICDQEKVLIEENLISALNSTKINLENLLKLTGQNINLFNTSSDFYNDICFHFESPNGKDITLRDRLLDYYPNITLCNEGCFCEGINLTTMMALCQCKFTEILSENIFSENAFVSKISDEIIEIITLSNLEILKCYKDVFSYKYFIKNIGGFIILGVIFFQTVCVIIFIAKSMNNMRKYSFGLIEIYLKYINPKYSIKYNEYISEVIKNNPPIKNKNKEKENLRKINKFKSEKKLYTRNIKLEHDNEDSENKYINLISHLSFKHKNDKNKDKNRVKTSGYFTNKRKNSINKSYLGIKINKYMKEYLSTNEDDMDYDDAIKKDKRKFCNFFWERVKVNTWIINIIFSEEKLKPRSIRLLLFLLNIDLYFVINGLFFNEEYISEVYHSNKEEQFFDFVSRTNYNLFYTSMVGALVEYMINCFFVEEKKFQNLFRREKDNEMRLRAEFAVVLNLIKSRYIAFFITSYVITLFSWYYATCFNNVYPNMKIEWIKSSICIIFIMIFVYIGLALLETILRFLSFKFKSEKIFKFSKIFSNCC